LAAAEARPCALLLELLDDVVHGLPSFLCSVAARRRAGVARERGEQATRRDRDGQLAAIDRSQRLFELRTNGGVGAEGLAQPGVDPVPQPRARLAAAPLLPRAARFLRSAKRGAGAPDAR